MHMKFFPSFVQSSRPAFEPPKTIKEELDIGYHSSLNYAIKMHENSM